MTARQELVVSLVVCIAAVLALFAASALAIGIADRTARRGNGFENRVLWFEAKCDQRPDGSAECEPGTFDPIPTTTTTAP